MSMKNFKEYSGMREVMVDTVIELAEENNNVVWMDADLAGAIGSKKFEEKFPKRYYNCGIAEANMVGVAAGLSAAGFRPFCHTFGCFASRRVFDQYFLSVGYAQQVVHMLGTDPGIEAESNGGTHMPFEDIGLMRQVPNIVIIEPSDLYSAYQLIKQIYQKDSPSYIRLPRKTNYLRYDDSTKVELGKGIEIESGEDIAIVASGMHMVHEAEKAVAMLKEKNINATLIDLHTIKPLDKDIIDKAAKRCKKMIVCENSRYTGGVGEMISNYIVQSNPIPMSFVNVGDVYGEVGDKAYLAEKFGLTAENIVKKVMELIKK